MRGGFENLAKRLFKLHINLEWYEKWFYNQRTGLLTFKTGDVELNFKYFEVGSFSEKSNTWRCPRTKIQHLKM